MSLKPSSTFCRKNKWTDTPEETQEETRTKILQKEDSRKDTKCPENMSQNITHTHCRLPPSYSRVAGTSKEKRAGREKTEKFQTHIYDMMLNCLSLCNSQSFFTAGWGRTKPAFCYSIVRLVLHPPIRFRAEVSGPLLHRRGAFATLGTP